MFQSTMARIVPFQQCVVDSCRSFSFSTETNLQDGIARAMNGKKLISVHSILLWVKWPTGQTASLSVISKDDITRGILVLVDSAQHQIVFIKEVEDLNLHSSLYLCTGTPVRLCFRLKVRLGSIQIVGQQIDHCGCKYSADTLRELLNVENTLTAGTHINTQTHT